MNRIPDSSQMPGRHRLIYHIDGVSHLVWGVPCLFFHEVLADLLGVPPFYFLCFLVVFVLYGVFVVGMFASAASLRLLFRVGIGFNLTFLAVVLISALTYDLTIIGIALHMLVVPSALFVLWTLKKSLSLITSPDA